MVCVHYEFYLTEDGIELFDDWVALASSAMEQTEGFQGLERLVRVDAPTQCHMLARFLTSDNAWTWAMSPEHIRVLERLDGHHLKPWRTTSYRSTLMPFT